MGSIFNFKLVPDFDPVFLILKLGFSLKNPAHYTAKRQ